MSKLIKHEENIDVWSKSDVIKKLFAPNLSDDEFMYFIGLGKSLQANPFKKEIWAVKYGNRAAQVFLARDFYRKVAQQQPDYSGHYSQAVYSNDKFEFKNGVVNHSWSFGDRGELLGAYGIGKRKGMEIPFLADVKAEEYVKDQSTWKSMPETMLKKVAEAQVLRMMYSEKYSGTYSEDEQKIIEGDNTAGLNETYKLTPPVVTKTEISIDPTTKAIGRQEVIQAREEKTEVLEVEDEDKKDD